MLCVYAWQMAPSEFWRMSPGEFHYYYEAKVGIPKQQHKDKWSELYEALD